LHFQFIFKFVCFYFIEYNSTMQQITALHKAIDNLRSHATELLQRYKEHEHYSEVRIASKTKKKVVHVRFL